MLRYIRSIMADNFDHPLLMGFFIVGVIFGIAGFLVQTLMTNQPIVAAFGGVYALSSIALAAFGYGLLYFVKGISILRDRSATYLSQS